MQVVFYSPVAVAKKVTQQGLSLLELVIVLLILVALSGLVLPMFQETPKYAQCVATRSSMKAIRDAIMGNIDGPGYLADLGEFPVSIAALSTKTDYCVGDLTKTTPATCTAAGNTWKTLPVFNPVIGMGWRGPYLQDFSTGSAAALTGGNFNATTHVLPVINPTDAVILDSFPHGASARRPIVLQNPGDDSPTDGNDCSIDVAGAISPDDCIRLVSAGSDGVLNTSLADAKASARGDDVVLYLKIADPSPVSPANDQTGCVLTD